MSTDGVAKDSAGYLPNPPAPERLLPEVAAELQNIAGPGGAVGLQPITSTNPDGDYPGIPVMELGRSQSA